MALSQDASFEWLSWPQSARPFDAAALSYIAALDADKDLELLNANGVKLRPECERVFKVRRTMLGAHALVFASV